jgi:hypothetical protein
MAKNSEKTTALPGLLTTVAAGFDVVTAHLWMVLIPVFLDLFYWIGPQLRSGEQIAALQEMFASTEATAEMAQLIGGMAGRTNLFTALSVPYLGIPGLMAGFVMPEKTPLTAGIFEIEGSWNWLGLFLLLSFLGLLLTTLYFGVLSRAVRLETGSSPGASPTGATLQQEWVTFVRRLPLYAVRVVAMVVVIFLIALLFYLPLLIVATLFTFFSPLFGQMVLFAGLAMILWLLLYTSFGIHGILFGERTVMSALRESVRLVRRNWLATLFLLLLILAVRNVLSWLWLLVDTGSWLTVVSIVGYGFVNTSLLAATFIFYRDRLPFAMRA